MKRRNLRPILACLQREANKLVIKALDGRTDEEVADIVIELADRILVGEAVPGAGLLVEILTDGALRLIRPRVVQRVAEVRARQAALGAA